MARESLRSCATNRLRCGNLLMLTLNRGRAGTLSIPGALRRRRSQLGRDICSCTHLLLPRKGRPVSFAFKPLLSTLHHAILQASPGRASKPPRHASGRLHRLPCLIPSLYSVSRGPNYKLLPSPCSYIRCTRDLSRGSWTSACKTGHFPVRCTSGPRFWSLYLVETTF